MPGLSTGGEIVLGVSAPSEDDTDDLKQEEAEYMHDGDGALLISCGEGIKPVDLVRFVKRLSICIDSLAAPGETTDPTKEVNLSGLTVTSKSSIAKISRSYSFSTSSLMLTADAQLLFEIQESELILCAIRMQTRKIVLRIPRNRTNVAQRQCKRQNFSNIKAPAAISTVLRWSIC